MSFKELPIMKEKSKGILLFYPYISKKSATNIKRKLAGRWIGQGPAVDKFEKILKKDLLKKIQLLLLGQGQTLFI